MTRERGKLTNPGNCIVVFNHNSKHPISSIDDVMFPTKDEKKDLVLKDVYHFPRMENILI